jgi:hypothetical protein
MSAQDEVTRQVLTRAGRFQVVAHNLQVKKVVIGDGARQQRYVVCFNPDEAERPKHYRLACYLPQKSQNHRMQNPDIHRR